MKNEFESEIEKSIKYYEVDKILMGEKIREKIPFGGRISLGRSKFDFWLLINGMMYALECKMQRNTSSFNLSDTSVFDNEQIQTMIDIETAGGTAVVGLRTLVNPEFGPECFFVRIIPLLSYLREKMAKSIKVETLRQLSFVHQIKRVKALTEPKDIIWDLPDIEDLPCRHRRSDLKLTNQGKMKESPYDIIEGAIPNTNYNDIIVEMESNDIFERLINTKLITER